MVILLLAVAGHGVEAKKPAREDSKVKNIIYMIGDGMGLCHVSMLQIEAGYAPTAFDRAQNTALIKTYSANNRVTDSAAAGTALATGYKTDNGTIGQLPDGTRVESIMAKAEKQNYATGLVVTCYLQHATPAAFYAHVKGRGDSDRISYDFMESGVDVAFGGGSKIFKKAFEKVDVLVGPTSPVTAFKFGEKTEDPMAMYAIDITTIPANLAGVPAMSIPAGLSDDGLPVGFQFLAPQQRDEVMYKPAAALEAALEESWNGPIWQSLKTPWLDGLDK